MIDYDKYESKEELFDFLVSNKKSLIMQKKSALKQAEAVSCFVPIIKDNGEEIKASPKTAVDLIKQDSIRVKAVINTTKLADSHRDVHMDGTFKQSTKQQKQMLHLQEHESKFDKIISDSARPFLKNMKWSDIGYDFKGETEAFCFDSEIKADRNPFMFEQYAKGYVKNHSVGMQYITLFLCINDERYPAEKANWDKYYPEVANKDVVDSWGMFWAVTEAKAIEGSAVVRGSNYATPTISVKENIEEPAAATPKENTEAAVNLDTVDKETFRNLLKNITK